MMLTLSGARDQLCDRAGEALQVLPSPRDTWVTEEEGEAHCKPGFAEEFWGLNSPQWTVLFFGINAVIFP